MTVLAIGADVTQLSEFRDVFGMRFLGLMDPSSSVYNAWRVPDPTAPYPQDYVVDQQGVVRYWNDQYDPQAVIATIDRLLASGSGEKSEVRMVRAELKVRPSPARNTVVIVAPAGERASVYDCGGRLVRRLSGGGWDLRDGAGRRAAAGVYLVRAGTQAATLVLE
ncbi:hypothetical protein FJY71_09535 [candidate division WOR-3 bacterium]|nr:hypothetical protein [candidate division WOR-3 bacterium]